MEPPLELGGLHANVAFPLVAVSWKFSGELGWFDVAVRDFIDGPLTAPSLSVTVRVMV